MPSGQSGRRGSPDLRDARDSGRLPRAAGGRTTFIGWRAVLSATGKIEPDFLVTEVPEFLAQTVKVPADQIGGIATLDCEMNRQAIV